MKNLTLFLFVFVAIKLHSGILETFSDGNFTENPAWLGDVGLFKVNQNYQLQSAAPNSGFYSLYTPSNAIHNGVWEFDVKIDYSTSSSNFVSVYIISDQSPASDNLRGYYVQIGNTNDEVSLYCQEGVKKTKIIDGTDKRTDGKTVELSVRVTRNKIGKFELYSRLKTETDYYPEGNCIHQAVQQSGFFGLTLSCTSSTGSLYSFDNIRVEGTEIPDTIKPVWKSIRAAEEKYFLLHFSEPVQYSNFQLKIDDVTQSVLNIISHPGDTLVSVFPGHFPLPDKRYKIGLSGITDFYMNTLTDSTKFLVLSQHPLMHDVYFNEIMFNPNDSSAEYIEFYNPTEKLLDLSDLMIATMKTDGSYQNGKPFPAGTLMEPFSYLVITPDSVLLRKFHHCPDPAVIIQMDLYALSNETGKVSCFNKARNLVYDVLYWNDNLHHVLLQNTKGISLEKVNANMPSEDTNNWHSCATVAPGGTPGYQNSQYIGDINNDPGNILVHEDYFTPDNDGDRDLFLVKLRLEEPGYMLSAVVLSHSGEKVKTILSNQLASAENNIYWDGSNNDGQIVLPGIYLIFLEYFHPLLGKRSTSSIPVAVAFR